MGQVSLGSLPTVCLINKYDDDNDGDDSNNLGDYGYAAMSLILDHRGRLN